MYFDVSEEFKKTIREKHIISTARITILDSNTILPARTIKKVMLKDYCNDEGKVIGTVMSKELEVNFSNNTNLNLNGKKLKLDFGLLINDKYEYVPYGTYIVTKFSDDKANNQYKVIAYDYMTKFNPDFIDTFSYPMTLWQFYTKLCEYYGVEYENQEDELPNTHFIVKQKPVFAGKSGRIALARVAELFGSFGKVNRNNKMQMFLKTETDEEISASDMNTTLDINDIPTAIDTVVLELGGGVEGENVTKTSQTNKYMTALRVDAQTGKLLKRRVPVEKRILRITDNPFIYTQELREQVIDELFERVKGFGYTPIKLQYKGRFYYDCGDVIRVQDSKTKEYHQTIIMNQYLEIPSTRQSTINNDALNQTQIKYLYETKDKQANRHVELIVNKLEGTITSLVSEVSEYTNKFSKIEQSLNEISTKVTDLEDLTKEISGPITSKKDTTSIITDKAMAGEVVKLSIRAGNSNNDLYKNGTFYSTVFSNKTFFSNNTYFKGDSLLRINDFNYKDTINYSYAQSLIDKNTHAINRYYSPCKSLWIKINNNKTYKILKVSSSRFAIGTFTDEPNQQGMVANQYISDENEGEGKNEFSVTTTENDNWLLIFYYDSNNDTLTEEEIRNSIKIYENYQEIDLKIKKSLKYYNDTVYDEFDYDSSVDITKEPSKAKVIRRVGVLDDGSKYALADEVIEYLDVEDIVLSEGSNYLTLGNGQNGYATIKYVQKNAFTDKFATSYEITSGINQLANKIEIKIEEKVDKDTVLASITTEIKDHKGIIELTGDEVILKGKYLSIDGEGNIICTSGKIGGWLIKSYGLLSPKIEDEKLGDHSSSGIIAQNILDSEITDLTALDVAFFAGRYRGKNRAPVFYVTNSGKIHGKLVDLYDNDLNDPAYIRIYNPESKVGTLITSGKIVTGDVIGGYTHKGVSFNGPCVIGDNSEESHHFAVDWHYQSSGYFLRFWVDSTMVGAIKNGVTISDSDNRFKENKTDIDSKLLNAINIVEYKLFNFKGEKVKTVGIIAQDLIEAFKSQGLDYKNYSIISENEKYKNDKTLYFSVDYQQLLILKNKCLESKINKLEKRVNKIIGKGEM